RTTPDGQPSFGLRDPHHGRGCWLGAQTWQVTAEAGREVGFTLWRAFLDAGGPWPTEFRLTAAPRPVALPAQGASAYRRCGPRCHQVWELIERRERPWWM